MSWSGFPTVGRGVTTVALAASAWLAVAAASVGEEPDPVALLREVEAARALVVSGRLDIFASYRDDTFAKHPRPPTRLVVSFLGPNRHYAQHSREASINPEVKDGYEKLKEMDYDLDAFVRAGFAQFRESHIRSAYDGTQLMQYAEGSGAHIKDPAKGSGYYCFDPRALGISTHLLMTTTVPNYLADRDAKSVSLVGSEEIDGHRTWHVRVVDKYDQDKHFWIGDSPARLVYKSERITQFTREVVTSEYGGPAGPEGPLPVRTRTLDYRNGKLARESFITMVNVEYNAVVDPEAWTLAGLRMPPGEAVLDDRIRQRVGYWDGKALTEDYLDSIGKRRAPR